MPNTKFTSGDTFPELTVQKVNQSVSNLAEPEQDNQWRVVVVYRGHHCPICDKQLKELEQKKQKFYDLKTDLIAVSADSLQQASEQVKRTEITFPVAYGLTVDQMRQLGLYISEPRSKEETDHPFAEPAIFVINDKGKVQIVDISNAPFSRPNIDGLLQGIKFIQENDYPIRGTYQS
jgi:peroxiredoxin